MKQVSNFIFLYLYFDDKINFLLFSEGKQYKLGFLAVPDTPFQMSKMINVSLSVSEVHFEEDSGCHSLDRDDFVFDVEGMIMSLPLQSNSLLRHTHQ